MTAFLTLPMLLVLVLVCISSVVRPAFTRFEFREGFMIIRRGIVFRSEKIFELQHLSKVDIKRGPLDLLSRNGKLIMNFEGHRVVLQGLAPIGELPGIRDRLMYLRRLIRSHPLAHGIATS